jgi:hypothetical protein
MFSIDGFFLLTFPNSIISSTKALELLLKFVVSSSNLIFHLLVVCELSSNSVASSGGVILEIRVGNNSVTLVIIFESNSDLASSFV